MPTVRTWTISFSPDSKSIATGTYNGTVEVYDVETGEKTNKFQHGNKFVMSQVYSRNGKYLACASIDGIVNIFDLETQQLLHKIEGNIDVLYMSF